MKSIGKLMILMLVSISLISLLGFKQVEQEKQDIAAMRKAAMFDFNRKYDNNWKIYWNNRLGTPSYIMGHKISKYSGTPEEIAVAFMNEEKVMLGIENVERDMEVTKTNYSEKGGTRLTYTQKYKDVHILESGYLIAVKNSEIYYVSGVYYPEVDVNTEPTLSDAQVTGVIRSDLFGLDISTISEPKLYIYVDDSDTDNISYLLVKKIESYVSEPIEAWSYIIDAQNGNIISKISLIFDVNGAGKVYETNPIHGDTVRVTLYRISSDYSPRKLIGENVKVYNDSIPGQEATSPTASFIYDPDNIHFDEVMVYYHCDEFETWLITLGMGYTKVDTVEAHVHDKGSHLAYAIPSIRKIGFSNGVKFNKNDPAEESCVINHEYMHVVSEQYHTLYPGDEPMAMDEAYSDYFAVARKNDILSPSSCSYIGDWTYYPSYIRDLEEFMDYDDFSEENDPHVNCKILSGALWDFRTDNDVSSSEADVDVLESLNNLSPSTNFLDARIALITAAYSNGHSGNVDDIVDAFNDHKIYSPLTVEIDGWYIPYAYYDWENKWWAEVSGGETPYTYAWSMRVDYEEWSDWESVGSDSIYNIEMHDWEYLCEELFAGYNLDVGSNIQLKVVVTDNAEESEEEIIGLEVTDPQKKIAAEQLPKNFKLEQNYPNPFNPATTINFQLPKASNVTLVIYNIQGREVARLVDGYVEAGYHSVNWDASNAASGIYIYRLQAGSFSDIKRMLYIK